MTVEIWLHRPEQRHPDRREQSRLARSLLLLACSRRGIPLNEDQLDQPGLTLMDALLEQYRLSVSLAHCRTLVAVALGSCRLGLDCEPSDRHKDWPAIAGQFFSPEEAAIITSAHPADRRALFLRHWVLKEAYIKAIRGSVFGDLNRLRLGPEQRLQIEPHAPGERWWAWQGQLAACTLGLCCAQPTAPHITFHESIDPAAGIYASRAAPAGASLFSTAEAG